MLVDDVIKTIKNKKYADVEQALVKQFPDSQVVCIDRIKDNEPYNINIMPTMEVQIDNYSFVFRKFYPYKAYNIDDFVFDDVVVSNTVMYDDSIFNLYETTDKRYIISRD